MKVYDQIRYLQIKFIYSSFSFLYSFSLSIVHVISTCVSLSCRASTGAGVDSSSLYSFFSLYRLCLLSPDMLTFLG